MPHPDETDPVADDELLYRRVPVSKGWYASGGLSPEAFLPRRDEDTGISVFRAKYKTLDDAAHGRSKQGYYVAVFRAGDLRRAGIEVAAAPLVDEPGHAELTDLTCHNRHLPESIERQRILATSYLEVKGPFLPE